ncbi:hypothetical protein C770_GR4pC0910 (plasmid) [Sinorhizobium meliloti GR4]|nr:hypothetical protein C770_GR4pC0910 [Sinorhizobium meliloti GR4]
MSSACGRPGMGIANQLTSYSPGSTFIFGDSVTN